ncbi:branched-chain amino acid ABC transporter permease [Halobacteriales archaeon QS_4_66_20]|nr:MAG: branched-chain amino acid ABC transporter permease [Halobacteriales archaeon QS_4_66_20]
MSVLRTSNRVRGFLSRRSTVLALLGAAILLLDLTRRVVSGDIAGSSLALFLWDGVVIGLVVGLAGIGLSMTYNILSFANFAHGDYLTAGAFSGWVAAFLVAGAGRFDVGDLFLLGGRGGAVDSQTVGVSVTATPVAVVVGMLVAAGVTAVLALVVDRAVYRPIRDRSGISLLIASIGVAFILRYVIAFVFETERLGVTSGAKVPSTVVPLLDVRITAHEATLVVIATGLMFGFHVFLQRTKLGAAMRAMSDNKQLARITGIPVERIVRLTWVIGGSFTGIAGFLVVLESGSISFNFGWLLLLLIFAAVILGGIGSIYGAILGGLTIGVISRLSLVWLPPSIMNATAFAVMILVLIVRPRGLFSGGTSV